MPLFQHGPRCWLWPAVASRRHLVATPPPYARDGGRPRRPCWRVPDAPSPHFWASSCAPMQCCNPRRHLRAEPATAGDGEGKGKQQWAPTASLWRRWRRRRCVEQRHRLQLLGTSAGLAAPLRRGCSALLPAVWTAHHEALWAQVRSPLHAQRSHGSQLTRHVSRRRCGRGGGGGGWGRPFPCWSVTSRRPFSAAGGWQRLRSCMVIHPVQQRAGKHVRWAAPWPGGVARCPVSVT